MLKNLQFSNLIKVNQLNNLLTWSKVIKYKNKKIKILFIKMWDKVPIKNNKIKIKIELGIDSQK